MSRDFVIRHEISAFACGSRELDSRQRGHRGIGRTTMVARKISPDVGPAMEKMTEPKRKPW